MLQVYVIVQFLCFGNWLPKTATDWQGVSPVTKQEEGGRTEEKMKSGNTREKSADILRTKRKAFSKSLDGVRQEGRRELRHSKERGLESFGIT